MVVDEQVLSVFDHEAREVSAVVREQADQHGDAGIEREDLIARAAYSVGLEIGLAIAVRDGAAGRRLRDWMARVVQQDDPAGIAGREHQAYHYLRVLDR